MQLGATTATGLDEKLAEGRPLTVKIGFDPTAPDLHLGHFVVLRGARRLQDAGHRVVVIVGDFTASVGDPSGRNVLRPPLAAEAIAENAKTYVDQASKVLDPARTEVLFNSAWLAPMTFSEVLSLMSHSTLSQMLAREDFRRRHEAGVPVHMHEMAYPMMQGLDSVVVKADVEIGGTDQTFNLLMGREMQKARGMAPQAVVAFPLLPGLDGIRKMSKSLGNHVGLLDSPDEKFGKLMSVSDETLWTYLKALEERSDEEIAAVRASGRNPKEVKADFAERTCALFDGPQAARAARQAFDRRFSRRSTDAADAELSEVPAEDGGKISLPRLIRLLAFAVSVSDAARKIEGRGVKIDGTTVEDRRHEVSRGDEFLLKVGKLHLRRVRIV